MKTFVVRLFVPADAAPDQRVGALQGLIEEIGTERRSAFTGEGDLLGFIAAGEEDGSTAGEPPTRKDRA